jgi:hypothetical protein
MLSYHMRAEISVIDTIGNDSIAVVKDSFCLKLIDE